MATAETTMKRISGNNIVSPIGFKAAGMHCGIKHKKNDLALLVSEVPASVAGVFTTNVNSGGTTACHKRSDAPNWKNAGNYCQFGQCECMYRAARIDRCRI